jgi:hypothetical protein
MAYQSIKRKKEFGFVRYQRSQSGISHWIIAISAIFAIEGHAQGTADSTVLTSYSTNNTRVAISKSLNDDDDYVTWFQANARTSQLIFSPKNNVDWSHASAFKISVYPETSDLIDLSISIKTAANQNYYGKVTLVPYHHATVVLPFQPIDPAAHGMVADPWLVNYQGFNIQQVRSNGQIPASTNWNSLNRVVSITLESNALSQPQKITFGQPNVQIGGAFSHVFDHLIDAFGQSHQADWPEKVKDTSEMISQEGYERIQLQKWTSNRSSVDAYGGDANLRVSSPSSFFRVLQSNQRAWFSTPLGGALFLLGIDAIDYASGTTIVTGRESMFEYLESLKAAFPDQWQFYNAAGMHTFNHYAANLERKYGTEKDIRTGMPQWQERWKDLATYRLLGWGFNTIGSKSAIQFMEKPTLPFVLKYSVDLNDVDTVSSNHGGVMPDPFGGSFDQAIKKMISSIPAYLIKDKLLIGYYVDNELPWGNQSSGDYREIYALPVHTLELDYASSPAKQVFVAQLQAKYRDIDAMADAWKISASSWDQLKKPFSALPAIANATMTADLSEFLARYAGSYFSKIRNALKEFDPNHLYLGCRFSEVPVPALEQAVNYCDVVSFNYYGIGVHNYQKPYFAAIKKPFLISEFHFGSSDRGPFWSGVVSAGSESERGTAYRQFVSEFAKLPNCVGCTWFQYTDEPTAGRPSDGENGHIGFVSIADVAYQNFAAAVHEANQSVTSIHAKASY